MAAITFKSELRADMEALRSSVRADLAELKAELIKWMFGGFLTIAGMLVAILLKVS